MTFVIVQPRNIRRRNDSLTVLTALFVSLGALPVIWTVLVQLYG